RPRAPCSPLFPYTTLFRSVLIMMIGGWIFCAQVLRLDPALSPLLGVIIGLTLYNGSVIAELVRSGVHGLPKGQREAGLAIGMTRSEEHTSELQSRFDLVCR